MRHERRLAAVVPEAIPCRARPSGATLAPSDMAVPTGLVRFGVFEVDLATGELRRKGVKVALTAQAFAVLTALIETPGGLVTREALCARIWPDAVHLDFEHGLNKAVHRLRQALGDSTESPRFVETLSRRGYRFIAPIEARGQMSTADSRMERKSRFRILWGLRVFPLRDGANFVGRGEGTDVVVESVTVSRRHARIVVEGDHATIEDLGSRNGTLVDGRRVTEPTALVDGSAITTGSEQLIFRASATGTAPTKPLDP